MNRNRALGLPEKIGACLFDLDGVLVQTAPIHAAAWKETFDTYLKKRAENRGDSFIPFDEVDDYRNFIDGKIRIDGARSFLHSRDIRIPEGDPGDAAGTETIHGLSNGKNRTIVEKIREYGIEPYEGSVRYLHAVQAAGLSLGVVSSSTHCADVLKAAGIDKFFQVRIDGVSAAERELAGKPSPAMYLAAVHSLGMTVGQAAVFEDALAGVEAGRAGGFGFVVGIDRMGEAETLRDRGADVVVADLTDLLDHS